MKNSFAIIIVILVCITINLHAQLTPHDAAKAMGRGINLGNTLEAPTETAKWGIPITTASNFDDYKNAGFTCVRLPVTWDDHTASTSPYTIDAAWLNRIDTIVTWGLQRGLIIILNAHHETWLKTAYTNANKERFDSIWSQIATRFQNKSDSLMFEVINEPLPLSSANVDDVNARIITIMRRTNPTRIILFSGYEWSNSYDLIAAAIPHDSLLIGYYHSYDPLLFAFCGMGTYGSDDDINGTIQKFDQVASWSTQHNVPVVLSEFGAHDTSDYNSRMLYYGTVTQQALAHNVPFNAWEDGGEFKFYNRTQHTWTEVKDILIHTYKESPNNFKISLYDGTSIKIQWRNNTTENDSIVIERKDASGNFSSFATIASPDSIFIDTTTKAGTAYYYRVSVNVKDSIVAESYPIMLKVPESATSVPWGDAQLHFQLSDNYPNPFNPSTNISFSLPSKSFVSLKLFDVIGREVATIVSEQMSAGNYTKQWNANGMPSGVYFYRLSVVPTARPASPIPTEVGRGERDLVPTNGRNGQAGSFTQTKKLLFLK